MHCSRMLTPRKAAMLAAALALSLVAPLARADQPATLEVGVHHSDLTGPYGDWRGAFARVTLPAANGATYLEAVRRSEFNDVGMLLSAGRVQDIDADWGVSGFVSGSPNGGFWPHFRWDVGVSRKVLADRSLVLGAIYSHSINRQNYRDDAVLLSTTWYGLPSWVLEQGLRFTVSHPGSVSGQRWYGVATWSQPKVRELSARLESGTEGWQALGAQSFDVGFSSTLLGLSWTEWLTSAQGIKASVEHYSSPNYHRTGLDLSVFTQF